MVHQELCFYDKNWIILQISTNLSLSLFKYTDMIRDSNKIKYNPFFLLRQQTQRTRRWTQTLKNLKEH
jgi:hypothetical protein